MFSDSLFLVLQKPTSLTNQTCGMNGVADAGTSFKKQPTMIVRTLKLSTKCRDKATMLKGTVTHWICNMGGNITYIFQPEGTNPEDGQPVHKISLEIERLDDLPPRSECFEEIAVPSQILGSIVTDNASGFTGTAVSFLRHMNGCFHVFIQPAGVVTKTNTPINKMDFDLRQCTGEKIAEMKASELTLSRTARPSPINVTLATDMPSEARLPA